jgi:hypothetical protein
LTGYRADTPVHSYMASRVGTGCRGCHRDKPPVTLPTLFVW